MLEALYLHTLAIPLCHLKQLLAEAVLHSPALASASQLQLAALAEALVLPEAAAKAEKKAGPLQLSVAQSDQSQKVLRPSSLWQHISLWLSLSPLYAE